MIGIDIIKTDRMHKMMKKFPQKALQRFLCDEEIALVKSPKTAAGFWAAKEAFSKALGTGIGAECSFKDMRIYKTAPGAPRLALAKHLVEKFDILDVSLSITHDGEYAICVVAIEVNSPATDKVKQF
jgi:holo-[acyl-carrier protein] synthase